MTVIEQESHKKYSFVSVVLPTFNRSDFLEGAFYSLVAQDYPTDQFEIIVVDNRSSDDTPQRMSRLAQETYGKINLKYVRENRSGLVFARHTGAVHADGELLLFGDDDAVFDKNWISAIVDVFSAYPEVGAVGTKISILWDREPAWWVRKYEKCLGKLDYGKQVVIRQGLYINGGSFAIRKPILYQLDGFNPGQRGPYIVGDSECGLCRKLATNEILVAWTPAATMWHLQRADINGTFEDLKRRYRNNGISDAYYASFYGWTLGQLVLDICLKNRELLRKLCGLLLRRDIRDVILALEYFRYYLKYLWLYRFNSTVRAQVNKEDWLLGRRYEAPAATLSTHYGQIGSQ